MATSSYDDDQDKAKNSVLYFPSTDRYPKETYEQVKLELLENKIELALVPAAINALIRTSMYIDVNQRFIVDDLYILFRKLTSTSQDKKVVEAIIQSCIAVPEPNRLIDYSFAKAILSKLFMNDDLNPEVLRAIIQNINDQIIDTSVTVNTDLIIVDLVHCILEENQEINNHAYEIIDTQFKKGTWYACLKTSEAILKGLENNKFSNLSMDHLSSLWERAKQVIYDPDKELLIPNYHIAQNCAKLIGCFVVRNHKNIFSYPELIIPYPLNNLSDEPSILPFFGGNPMKRLVIEIVDEIEKQYRNLIDDKYTDSQMRFAVSYDLIGSGKLRRHYMAPFISKE